MKKLIMFAGCLLLTSTSACQCSPPITAQEMGHDIVGKTVSISGFKTGKPDTWTFKSDDETEIAVVRSTCRSGEALITIDVKTRASAGIAIARAAGRLRLSYERVGDGWVLRKVENESFKGEEIIIGSPPG